MVYSAVGKNCPYCQFPIKRESEVKWCPVCKMPHHIDCWKENKGCTTFACPGGVKADSFNDLGMETISDSSDQEKWTLYRKGIQLGPFSRDQLNDRYVVKPEDWLWSFRHKKWIEGTQFIRSTNPVNSSSMDIPFSDNAHLSLGMQHAGFWLRFAAIIIDSIILVVCFVIFELIVSGSSDSILFFIFIQWMYYSLFETSTLQATPGKLAVGIQVSDLYGEKIDFGKASGRFFGKLLSGLILGIGYFMAGFTKEKQALHDILAGCYVIKK